jgi:hypothetical protein
MAPWLDTEYRQYQIDRQLKLWIMSEQQGIASCGLDSVM